MPTPMDKKEHLGVKCWGQETIEGYHPGQTSSGKKRIFSQSEVKNVVIDNIIKINTILFLLRADAWDISLPKYL